MLQLNNLAIRRGPRQLFHNATMTIANGRKVGIVGPNGCGKSSLFELIRNELDADEGSLNVAGNPVIAHVAQHTDVDQRSPVEHVLDGDAELRDLQARIEAEPANSSLQTRMEEIDGYSAEARASRLLDGLGFDTARLSVPVETLSGGWRMRINLARALMCRSDLLLLDEPTNHLDLDAVIWLEDWLRRYSGTLLLISHDREFLDRSVDHILAYEGHHLVLCTGSYSDYEQRRAERLGQRQAAFQKQQREIAHMENFVRRFRYKATKARQAQSRLKALERMATIAPAHVDTPFSFSFKQPQQLPDPLVRLDEATVGYGGVTVLGHVKLSLSPGDRIGLLGLNGAGKSTLSRLLAGELPVINGERREAKHLRIGYFAQHQLELLNPEHTPADHFVDAFGLHEEQRLRDFLGGFGFSGDRVFEPVGPFSGGEKARLVLAMVVYAEPNLLILDEPTNHLDLEMRFALTLALQEFAGAVVLVSHDRHLLKTSTSELLLVDSGKVDAFDGSLDDYPRWLTSRRNRGESLDNAGPQANRKQHRQSAASLRKQLKPLSDRVRQLERELEKLTHEAESLDDQLADPELYAGDQTEKLTRLNRQRADIARQAGDTEEQWMEAMERLEQAQSASGP